MSDPITIKIRGTSATSIEIDPPIAYAKPNDIVEFSLEDWTDTVRVRFTNPPFAGLTANGYIDVPPGVTPTQYTVSSDEGSHGFTACTPLSLCSSSLHGEKDQPITANGDIDVSTGGDDEEENEP